MPLNIPVIKGFTGDGAVICSYIRQAYNMAKHSKDPSTQVGCVIVNPSLGAIATACNDIPKGLFGKDTRLTVDKEIYIEHAERNAIFKCASIVLPSIGCHLYTTWLPCAGCCRAIIQSGIVRVIGHKNMYDAYNTASMSNVQRNRVDSIKIGIDMLNETGIECLFWEGVVFPIPTTTIRVRGQLWKP